MGRRASGLWGSSAGQHPLPNSLSDEHRHSRTLPEVRPTPWHAALETQDPDSLFCHLVEDHPVKVACALPFLHGPPHSLLQRHGGLQAEQGPEHWAVNPQGRSGPTARPPPA